MKRSRLFTVAAAVVAVGATALATTGAANAASDPSVDYVNTAAQLSSTSTPFDSTAAGWTVFDSASDVTFGPGGATISGDSPLVLAHAVDAPATSLTDLVGSEQLVTISGSAYLGWALSDDDGGAYYLISTAPGAPSAASTFSFFTAGGTNNTTLTTNTNYSLADVQAGFAADTTAAFDAYGITNFPTTAQAPVTATSTVAAIDFNGVTTYFTPTPQPLTVSPTTTTVSGIKAGVTVSGTGFFPGETITTGYGTGASGNDLPTTFTAAADGTVTGLLPVPSATAPGTYSLVLLGSTSNVIESGLVTVTADPTAPTTPATPTTPAAPVATPVSATASFTG